MKKRNAIILLLIVLLISAIATIGFMYYMDKFSLRGFVDVATWVAVAVLVIGVVCMMGGSSNKSDYSYHAARMMSSDRDTFDKADYSGSAGSLAFGLVLSGSAIVWGVIAYLIYHFLGK